MSAQDETTTNESDDDVDIAESMTERLINIGIAESAREHLNEAAADSVPIDSKVGTVIDTPFERTIIYNDEDNFETAAAVMAARAQLIPMFTGADKSAVVDSIPYLSPNLIIMSGGFTREYILEMLKRGFQQVHIFIRRRAEAAGYLGRDPNTLGPHTDLASGLTFDARVELFGLENVYDTLAIDCGLAASILLERLTLLHFPGYKNPGFTIDDATALRTGMISTGRKFVDIAAEVVHSWRGFQMIEELTMRGKIITEIRQQIARERISRYGVKFDINLPGEKPIPAIAVPAMEFLDETSRCILDAGNQVGIMYRYESDQPINPDQLHEETTPAVIHGYCLWLVLSDSYPTAILLREVIEAAAGIEDTEDTDWKLDNGRTWVKTSIAHRILPFLA